MMLAFGALADDHVCLRTVVTKKEICSEEKHPLAGAGIGWLVLGPLGAIAGAVIGSNPSKDCHQIEESSCAEYAPVPKKKRDAMGSK